MAWIILVTAVVGFGLPGSVLFVYLKRHPFKTSDQLFRELVKEGRINLDDR